MGAGVLIVDDQPITRSGLTCIIESLPGYRVAAEAEDGTQVVAKVREHDVDLVLMDLRMPRVDGVEATRRLMGMDDPPPVIAMTTFAVDEHALEALEAGARGFVMKDIRPEELHFAMESVMNGGSLVSTEMLGFLVTQASRGSAAAARPHHRQELLARLSESEHRVLALVGAGLSNAQIAGRLYLSVSSVKAHVSRVLQKLALENRTQAAVLAHELGLPAD
ncbi:response regulator transcription factor [Streptomyces sp. NPDC051183]|uniref:response regulator transcription factor n=1 Tax=unclassified Streptomyces TaxID=2593676 RepID=UPI003423E6A2